VQEELAAEGLPPFDIAYTTDWHLAPGVLDAVAARIAAARATLPAPLREGARLVFTAHSIPTTMPVADRYVMQLRDSATSVAALVHSRDWALVFQSRSGRPEDPWLEPDVNDYLREARAGGLEAAILVPIGFLADHVEVLYDLDVEARATADEIGLTLARAEAVNDHPRFIDALADVVSEAVSRYRRGRPLSIVPAEPPAKRELPPPVRPAAAT
jgi:ferrochelatase